MSCILSVGTPPDAPSDRRYGAAVEEKGSCCWRPQTPLPAIGFSFLLEMRVIPCVLLFQDRPPFYGLLPLSELRNGLQSHLMNGKPDVFSVFYGHDLLGLTRFYLVLMT